MSVEQIRRTGGVILFFKRLPLGRRATKIQSAHTEPPALNSWNKRLNVTSGHSEQWDKHPPTHRHSPTTTHRLEAPLHKTQRNALSRQYQVANLPHPPPNKNWYGEARGLQYGHSAHCI